MISPGTLPTPPTTTSPTSPAAWHPTTSTRLFNCTETLLPANYLSCVPSVFAFQRPSSVRSNRRKFPGRIYVDSFDRLPSDHSHSFGLAINESHRPARLPKK